MAELGKIENLMYEGIKSLEKSKSLWYLYQHYCSKNDIIGAEIAMRESDRHKGYAEGIKQALVCIGFKHDDMQKLI